jgi:hypothetical protein
MQKFGDMDNLHTSMNEALPVLAERHLPATDHADQDDGQCRARLANKARRSAAAVLLQSFLQPLSCAVTKDDSSLIVNPRLTPLWSPFRIALSHIATD